MSKIKKEKTFSDHHILPQHPFGTRLEGSSDSHNIIRITDVKHRAIHSLFDNLMLADQLIRTVELSRKALRPEVAEWLMDTLTSVDIHDPTLWYKEECIK